MVKTLKPPPRWDFVRQLLDLADFGGVSSSHISASLRYCATGMMAMMALMARIRCHHGHQGCNSGSEGNISMIHILRLLYQDYLKIVIYVQWHFLNLKKRPKSELSLRYWTLWKCHLALVPMKWQVSRGTAPAAPAPAPASTLAPVQKEVMEAFPAIDMEGNVQIAKMLVSPSHDNHHQFQY